MHFYRTFLLSEKDALYKGYALYFYFNFLCLVFMKGTPDGSEPTAPPPVTQPPTVATTTTTTATTTTTEPNVPSGCNYRFNAIMQGT